MSSKLYAIVILIPNIVFVVAVGILTLISAVISSTGSFSSDKSRKIFKRPNKRGKSIISLSILVVLLLGFQEYNNSIRDSEKDLMLQTLTDKSDSIVTHKVNENTKVLFENLAEALSKQNLEFDSVKKIFLKKNDAKVILVDNQKDPLLVIDNHDIKVLDKLKPNHFTVFFSNLNADATNIKITSYFHRITINNKKI